MTKKTSVAHLIPVLFGFFVMGFADLVGLTTTHVKTDFGLTDTMSNMIGVALFTMFLLFSVPTGILMNRIGRKNTVVLSNVLTIVALFIPLVSYTYITSLCAFALLGIANTILQVSLNPLLSNVVSGGQLTSSLTAGQFVKAISSFSAPFIAAGAAALFGHWKYMFPIFALLTLVSTVWLMATPIPMESEKGKASSFGEVLGLLKDTKILLLFLGILFVVGIDVGINTVAPKLLVERAGIGVDNATFGSSMYFAFRTAGAFTGAILLARLSASGFFRIGISVATAAVIALMFAHGAAFLYTLYAIIGFAVANIFSIIFSFALKHKPEKGNEISGLMITGVFGGAIISFLMGYASDAFGSQLGSVVVILACAVYLLFCSFSVSEKK